MVSTPAPPDAPQRDRRPRPAPAAIPLPAPLPVAMSECEIDEAVGHCRTLQRGAIREYWSNLLRRQIALGFWSDDSLQRKGWKK